MASFDFLIFGLLAALGFGVGDFLGAAGSRKSTAQSALFWTFSFLALFWFAFGLAKGAFAPLSLQSFALSLAVGFFFLIGDFLYLRATKDGKISVASPLLALSSIVTVALAMIVLQERPSFIHVISGVIAVVGGALVGLKELNLKRIEHAVFILFPAIVSHGIALTLAKILIEREGVIVGVSWFESLMLLFLIPFALANRRVLTRPVIENAGSALAYFAGFWGFATALSLGLVSIAAPVANLFPLVAVLLAVRLYKEELKRHQWLGFALALGGLVGIAL